MLAFLLLTQSKQEAKNTVALQIRCSQTLERSFMKTLRVESKWAHFISQYWPQWQKAGKGRTHMDATSWFLTDQESEKLLSCHSKVLVTQILNSQDTLKSAMFLTMSPKYYELIPPILFLFHLVGFSSDFEIKLFIPSLRLLWRKSTSLPGTRLLTCVPPFPVCSYLHYILTGLNSQRFTDLFPTLDC